jgi:hypothetical protein
LSHATVPDMPTPGLLLAVEAVGNELYSIGGSTSDYATLAAIEAFTPWLGAPRPGLNAGQRQ